MRTNVASGSCSAAAYRVAWAGLQAATLALIGLLLSAGVARAAGGEAQLMPAGNDIHNVASLQRGARNFMNYCSGCHSAQFVRYNRIAADLQIPESELKANLMFTGGRPFDTIRTSMNAEDARRWFGNAPPDLSLIARSRGTDYLYTFLKTFYADPTKPMGTNNLVLPGTAMPHVLAPLQGLQVAEFESVQHGGGATSEEFRQFQLAQKGALTPAEYEGFVRDTVNFLEYIGEPVQAKRQRLGVWVILFLLLFTVLAWLLKKEYWKDVR
jgi:ubiquinol-cytochrome c reductase cytochrome c1 subunit